MILASTSDLTAELQQLGTVHPDIITQRVLALHDAEMLKDVVAELTHWNMCRCKNGVSCRRCKCIDALTDV